MTSPGNPSPDHPDSHHRVSAEPMPPTGFDRLVGSCGLLVLGAVMGLGPAGCDHGQKIADELGSSNYDEAYEIASGKTVSLDPEDKRQDAAYHLLEAGRTAQLARRTEESIEWYERFYDRVEPYLAELPEETVSEIATSMLLNPSYTTYRGWASDRVLAAALNATNHLDLGDIEAARVSLKVSEVWQAQAIDRFEDEIARLQEAVRTEGAIGDENSDSEDPPDSEEPEERFAAVKEEHFADIATLPGYDRFENPFVAHLRGVFLATFGVDQADADESNRSLTLSRNLAGLPEDSTVPPTEADPSTFVYFMTGLGPKLETLKITVPIPIGRDQNGNLRTIWLVMAFPVMKRNGDFWPDFEIVTEDLATPGRMLADMDSIVGAEFHARLDLVLTQAAATGAAKGVLSAVLSAFNLEAIGNLAAFLSSSADTRIWRSIPKQILVARVPTPADGIIRLRTIAPPSDGGPEFMNGAALQGIEEVVAVQPGVSNIVLATLPSSRSPRMSITSIPMTLDRPAPPPAPADTIDEDGALALGDS